MKDESLKSLLTIVLPTHNRPTLLDNMLKYYDDFGVRLLVGDSSRVPLSHAKDYHCEYFHLPNMRIVQKWGTLVEKVKTPYMTFFTDDDFFVNTTLLNCLLFLKENPKYSIVTGDTIAYYQQGSEMILSSLYGYLHSTYDYTQPDVFQRVITCCQNTISCVYGVHKTTNVKSIFQNIKNHNISCALLLEFYFYFYVYTAGYIKILPNLYHIRTNTPQQPDAGGVPLGDLESAIFSKEKEAFETLLLNRLLCFYDKQTVIQMNAVQRIIDNILQWNNNIVQDFQTINIRQVLAECKTLPSSIRLAQGRTLKGEDRTAWLEIQKYMMNECGIS